MIKKKKTVNQMPTYLGVFSVQKDKETGKILFEDNDVTKLAGKFLRPFTDEEGNVHSVDSRDDLKNYIVDNKLEEVINELPEDECVVQMLQHNTIWFKRPERTTIKI